MNEEAQSYVVAGALLKCDNAETDQGCYLNLPMSHGVYTTEGKAQCHVGDRMVPTNISTFGMCKDGKPCAPVLPLDWVEGKQDVLVDGKSALISGCHLQCLRKGNIVIAEDGQGDAEVKATETSEELPKDAKDFENIINNLSAGMMFLAFGKQERLHMNVRQILNKLRGAKGGSGAKNVPKRPSWRQSEIDAELDYKGYDSQKSFLNGEEVPYGTKGSSRPELYKQGHSIEVKNYNVQTSSGQNNLINNVSKQIKERLTNLPTGTNQTILIDVRGQNVTNDALKYIRSKILEKSGGNVEIIFKR
ncbi:DUF4280 domain-containing protein [Listeria goaensis]|uniref:DUF4280 domain-containing protein n=1 Tax=Listeria goaensis TaxID=1649188 RepID=UPI001F07FBA8|nr:DUF4280 domain-containing protein [Listeria goaensis]